MSRPLEITGGVLFGATLAAISIFPRAFPIPLEWDITFGSFFQRRVIVPFGFWLLWVLVCALVPNRKAALSDRLMASILPGLRLQLGFLLIYFLRNGEFADLPETVSRLYAEVIPAGILGGLIGYSLYEVFKDYNKEQRFWNACQITLPIAALFLLPLPFAFTVLVSTAAFYVGFAALHGKKIIIPERAWVLAIVGVSLGFRVVKAYQLGGMGLTSVLQNVDDAPQYYREALRFLESGRIGREFSMGESAFVAGLMLITRQNIRWVLVLQSLLLSTIPLALYLLCRRLFGAPVATITGFLAALSPLLIFNSINLSREGTGELFSMWWMVIFVQTWCSKDARSFIWSAILGIVGAYLVLIEAVFLPIVCLVVALLLFQKDWAWIKRAAVIGSSFLLLFTLTYSLNRALSGMGGLLTRDPHWAHFLFTDYSDLGNELGKRNLIPADFGSNPGGFVQRFFSAPVDNGILFGRKIVLETHRYFLEGSRGYIFEPLAFVANSRFAAHLYVWGWISAVIGFAAIVRMLFASSKNRLLRLAFLLVPVLHACVYIVAFFGLTRFRATIHPFLLAWVAVGFALIAEKTDRARCSTSDSL